MLGRSALWGDRYGGLSFLYPPAVRLPMRGICSLSPPVTQRALDEAAAGNSTERNETFLLEISDDRWHLHPTGHKWDVRPLCAFSRPAHFGGAGLGIAFDHAEIAKRVTRRLSPPPFRYLPASHPSIDLAAVDVKPFHPAWSSAIAIADRETTRQARNVLSFGAADRPCPRKRLETMADAMPKWHSAKSSPSSSGGKGVIATARARTRPGQHDDENGRGSGSNRSGERKAPPLLTRSYLATSDRGVIRRRLTPTEQYRSRAPRFGDRRYALFARMNLYGGHCPCTKEGAVIGSTRQFVLMPTGRSELAEEAACRTAPLRPAGIGANATALAL